MLYCMTSSHLISHAAAPSLSEDLPSTSESNRKRGLVGDDHGSDPKQPKLGVIRFNNYLRMAILRSL